MIDGCPGGRARVILREPVAHELLGFGQLRLIARSRPRAHEALPRRPGSSGPNSSRRLASDALSSESARARLPSFSYSPPSVCEQLGLNLGLAVERARLLHAAVDERHHAQTVGGSDRFVAALEELQHEALDALRARLLARARVARRRSRAPCRTRRGRRLRANTALAALTARQLRRTNLPAR